MKKIVGTLGVAVFLLCGAATSFAQSAVSTATNPPSRLFASKQGFSFSYPPSWMVASKDQAGAVEQQTRAYLDKIGQVAFERFAVIVFDPNSGPFTANLNVVVTPGSMEAGEQHVEDMRSIVRSVGKAFGSEPTDVRISVESFAGRQTMVARYNVNMVGNQVSQMQVIIPGRNQTYEVTCSCAQANSAYYEPIFQAMVNSMTVDEGVSSLSGPVQNALLGAILGGAIGVLVGLLSVLKGRAQNHHRTPALKRDM